MAFGFRSINDSGEIIISDELQTLHFVGKAMIVGTPNGNFPQGNSSDTFPGFSGGNAANALDGRVLIDYSITTTGRPLAFIKPNTSAYDRWYALINQSNTGNDWTFQVLMSGTDATASELPELFCFVDANEIVVSGGYGMVVYQADGVTKTFDSRAQPLSVVGAKLSRPRLYPPNEGVPTVVENFENYFEFGYNDLDHDFHSNGGTNNLGNCSDGVDGVTEAHCLTPSIFSPITNHVTFDNKLVGTSQVTEPTIPHTNFMFSAPSLAQAVYARHAHGYTPDPERLSTAGWWVMYRTAFRIQDGGNTELSFQTGWGTYAAGYNFSTQEEQPSWFGDNTIISYSTGQQPYISKTINYTNATFIIADGTKYV